MTISYLTIMNNDLNDNATLVDHLKKGDEKAYVFLVDRYHHRLCVYANSLMKDKALAEDIVQNVFVRTWEKRESLKADFAIKNFLYRSVYHEFIDQYRKRKSVTTMENKYIEQLNRFVERDEAYFEKLMDMVKKEVEKLPPKSKKIFLMSKKDGFSNVEIADQLNVSKKTIEYHITKAFAILRRKAKSTMQPIPS